MSDKQIVGHHCATHGAEMTWEKTGNKKLDDMLAKNGDDALRRHREEHGNKCDTFPINSEKT